MKKLAILNQKENPIFNRKEVELNVEAEVTPKTEEAGEFVSKEFSTNQDNVKIKKIKGKFGSNNFIIVANVYSSKEDKDKTETKSKKEIEAEKKVLSEQNKEEEKKE